MENGNQRYFFGKDEHLCLRNEIGEVVEKGTKIAAFPVVANYVIIDGNYRKPRIAVSVAKRNFKLAVDRNFLKRRIREAYRLHKAELLATAEKNNRTLNIIIIYVPKEKQEYRQIEKGIVKLLATLCKRLETHSDISANCAD